MAISITLVIIGLTALTSFSAFSNSSLREKLLFSPYAVQHRGQWYRLLSHALIHGDTMHLVVNMFVLWSFGQSVERTYPLITPLPTAVAYGFLYVGGTLFATLPGMAKHRNDPGYRSVGASGAVSAVLFAQIVLLPTQPVSVFFIQQLPAWLFGVLYLIYSYAMDKRGGDNVAHDAHFYGAVFGVLFTFSLNPDILFHFGMLERAMSL